MNQQFNGVIEFIHNNQGVPIKKINRDAILEDDLWITGDDADDFIAAFVEHFKLDITGFEITDFFSDEGSELLGITKVLRRIMGIKENVVRKKLTVQDLEEWVKRGYWEKHN